MTDDTKSRQPPLPAGKRTRTFVYRPLDEGDRLEVEQGGVRFRANVPVEVADTVTIMQLLTESRETPDGPRTKAIERHVPLYKVLEGNPWFEIDGVQPERKKATARLPESADQYRGYAISWIAASMSAAAMDKRWAGEESLRQRCGVSVADLGYVRPFFDARHEECADLDAQRAA